jgi:hypothetical protein
MLLNSERFEKDVFLWTNTYKLAKSINDLFVVLTENDLFVKSNLSFGCRCQTSENGDKSGLTSSIMTKEYKYSVDIYSQSKVIDSCENL